jgi:Tfp pilus assembly protein PilV
VRHDGRHDARRLRGYLVVTRARADERGFTLIEVMVAATVLIVGVLGVLTMLDTANKTSARTKAREGAVNLAREAIEAVRAVPYPDLVLPQIETELKAQPGLADADPATGWQIRRRNITYTVTANVCSVDDGTLTSDGYGNHSGVDFCADSATEGTTDNNPDDYKRVRLDVSWRNGSQTLSARQEAVINNPGSAFAPAVKTLTLPSGLSSPVTSSVSSITFTVTTSSRAEGVRWTIDNVEQAPATATNTAKTTWQFTWDTSSSVVDGTYLIGAEAYDQFGQVGTGRTVTMVLNRAQPAAPSGFTGGRNTLWGNSFAEFEWNPNPERDVVGYRVYEDRLLTADRVVCETSVEDDASPTTCFDTSPPASVLPVNYYVVALAPARVGSGLELSPSAGHLVGDATPPGPPTGIMLERTADGTTIRWAAPADSDLRYYRIYRDDKSSYTVRLDRTGSEADLGITDPNATLTDSPHCYWLTAVDDDLAESSFAPSDAGICS